MDKLTEKIIELVPEIKTKGIYYGEEIENVRPITLEDCILALKISNFDFWLDMGDGYVEFRKSIASFIIEDWQLGKPLSEQSGETKRFLESILLKDN